MEKFLAYSVYTVLVLTDLQQSVIFKSADFEQLERID